MSAPVRSYAAVAGAKTPSNPSSPTAAQQQQRQPQHQQPARSTPSPPPPPPPAHPSAPQEVEEWEKVEAPQESASQAAQKEQQKEHHVTITEEVDVREKSVEEEDLEDEDEDEDAWLKSRILRHESTMDLPLSRDSSVDVDVYIDKSYKAAEQWQHKAALGKETTREERERLYNPRHRSRVPDVVPRPTAPPGYQKYIDEQETNPANPAQPYAREREFHDQLTAPNSVKMPYGMTWVDQTTKFEAKEPVKKDKAQKTVALASSEEETSTSEEEKAEILARYGSLDEPSRKRLVARDLKARQEEKAKEKTRVRDRERRFKKKLQRQAAKDSELKKQMMLSRGKAHDPMGIFDEFRCSFLEQNLKTLQDHWKGHPLGEIELVPISINPVKRFLKAMDEYPSYMPVLCFHGTRVENLGSIFEKGLCVPGEEGVRVAHGSAYGVGIYVGTGPNISAGYTNKPYMLICCTLKPPGANASTQHQGVTDHGGLMVIFKTGLVIPLFVANYSKEGIPVRDFINGWQPSLAANPNKEHDASHVYFEALRTEMKYYVGKAAKRHVMRMQKKRAEKELKRERGEKGKNLDVAQEGGEKVRAPWGEKGAAAEGSSGDDSSDYDTSDEESAQA